jgi:hypothetical protein
MLWHRRWGILLLALFLAACQPLPPTVDTITTATLPEISSPVSPATQMPEATYPSPTSLPTGTPLPSTPIEPTPESTTGPIKPILIEAGFAGGDGGTSYDVFFGRGMPFLVLYTDGQLLIQVEDSARPGQYYVFLEKRLSVTEICTLLKQIADTGFFALKGTGRDFPDDSIYRGDYNDYNFGSGAGSVFIEVNGNPSKGIYVEYPALDFNVVDPVKKVYELITRYKPIDMQVYVSDRVLLQVEHQPSEEWMDVTPVPPEPWPPEMPSLANVLADDATQGSMVVAGPQARQIMELMTLPGGRSFTEDGKSYFVVGRPLLPHESVDSFFGYPPRGETVSFELPFACPK